jgi:hypothetical protein
MGSLWTTENKTKITMTEVSALSISARRGSESGGEKVEIKVAEDGSLIGLGKEEEDDD